MMTWSSTKFGTPWASQCSHQGKASLAHHIRPSRVAASWYLLSRYLLSLEQISAKVTIAQLIKWQAWGIKVSHQQSLERILKPF